MNKITNIHHPKEIILFTVSRFFERAAFYGVRGLLVVYMLQSSLAMSEEKVFELYGWFVSSFVFSNILGALFGDLIIGNKWASVIGGSLQAIGAFVLCVPNELMLYTGLLLILIGSGFYSPNLISSIGKLYTGKEVLLDSTYTLLYIIVNVGAFLGGYVITLISQQGGYNVGFVLCGVIMLLSLIPIILYKQPAKQTEEFNFKVYSNKNIIIVISSILLSSFFWIVYDISSEATFHVLMGLEKEGQQGISSVMNSLGPICVVLFGIIFSVFWSFINLSRNIKLLLGFILATLSCVVLLLSSSMIGTPLFIMFAVSVLLISLAELFISPILTAAFIKYTNPKYLALIFTASMLPYGMYTLIMRILPLNFDLSFTVSTIIGIISFTLVSITLLIFLIVNKGKEKM